MNLLPCPFCSGSDLEFIDFLGDDDDPVLGKDGIFSPSICCECGAQGAEATSNAEAIALWNNRPPLEVFILRNYRFDAIIGVFDSMEKAEDARKSHIKENGLSPNDSELGDCHLEIQKLLINQVQENIYS